MHNVVGMFGFFVFAVVLGKYLIFIVQYVCLCLTNPLAIRRTERR